MSAWTRPGVDGFQSEFCQFGVGRNICRFGAGFGRYSIAASCPGQRDVAAQMVENVETSSRPPVPLM